MSENECDLLATRKCVPCRDGMPRLEGEALAALHAQLGSTWQLVAGHHLEREFRFPDFKSALAFVNTVGNIAEKEDHHPDIYLCWGKAAVKIWTHKVDGLTENDFIWAAKVEQAYENAVQ